jgi:dipeptidyl aminopeptidase/acylaminoacyl peptidase
MEDIMRRATRLGLLLLVLVGIVATVFFIDGKYRTSASTYTATQQTQQSPVQATAGVVPTSYLYYTLKQATGFVLARALKGNDGQPLSTPQAVAKFSDDFGLAASDSVLSMQLSPDGRYVAINGTRDDGEQVWMFDTQRLTMNLTPAYVLGNFLHWLPKQPNGNGHTFLYRPMLPLGPSAPLDSNNWNPGLWEVDAASGQHKNIDIHVPSAYLIDAAPSPDGSRIVYSTTAGLGLGSDTWLMNADGNSVTRLFRDSGGAQTIAALFMWSPDGKSIAFERLADSPTPFLPAGLWIMNSAGGQQRRLAETDGGHGYVPAWSPDSSKIAYVVRTNKSDKAADMQMQALQSAIAVVDVTTSRSWVIAAANQTGMPLNLNPLWSSDSTRITFTASNPTNLVTGSMPRYWSAHVMVQQMRSSVTPILTPVMSNVIAVG